MKHTLQSSETFSRWFSKLKDAAIKRQLLARLSRVENGHFGDFKRLDAHLFELRCFFGGGLRVYYTVREGCVVLLLVGGDKSTQSKDIEKARAILAKLGE